MAIENKKPVEVAKMLDAYWSRIGVAKGGDRIWAYTSWALLKEGYYSPDELMDLSLQNGFIVDSPLTKIKRGTQIENGVIIKNGSIIDGENVVIGQNSVLDKAQITGANIKIGRENLISGMLLPGNTVIGDKNTVRDIRGSNEGQMRIGNSNQIQEINVCNTGKQLIQIGNHNELHPGLNINCLFSQGKIIIGNYNSLGRDGGGVVSTAYRFNEDWWGDVLIGEHVETTRGAEVLGYSLLGWPLGKDDEQLAHDLFVNGPLQQVRSFFERVTDNPFDSKPGDKGVSLFGVVKVKMSCLLGTVKAKDATRIQCSFLRDIILQERNTVYFTVVNHDQPLPLRVRLPDRAMEKMTITNPQQLVDLPTEPQTDGYRQADQEFFESERRQSKHG